MARNSTIDGQLRRVCVVCTKMIVSSKPLVRFVIVIHSGNGIQSAATSGLTIGQSTLFFFNFSFRESREVLDPHWGTVCGIEAVSTHSPITLWNKVSVRKSRAAGPQPPLSQPTQHKGYFSQLERLSVK